MLISKKYGFIFIHIYKTAGTSIQHALMPYVANGYQRLANRILMGLDKDAHKFHNYYLPRPFPVHITARELSDRLGREDFDSYFSFAVVRNPWDRQVSMYKHILRDPWHRGHKTIMELGSFDDYLEWRCSRNPISQSDFVCSKAGDLLVDYVGRYEQLDETFQVISSKIGITSTLPKINVSDAKPYQEYYTKKSKALIEEKFASDIEMFGYEFEA